MDSAVLTTAFFLLVAAILADSIATLIFFSPAYRWGLPVFTTAPSVQPPPPDWDGSWNETEFWVFKVISADRVLVRPRMRFFGFRVQGVVGTLSWELGMPRLTFRLQLSVLVFWVIWLSLWLVGAVVGILNEGATTEMLFFAGFGIGIVALSASITLRLTRARAPEFIGTYEYWTHGSQSRV